MTRPSRTPARCAALAALAAALVACAAAPSAQAAPRAATPIEHFVMLMQEGHSFDNYFGRYPGADGLPAKTCMPADPAAGKRPCVRPFHLGDRSASLPHSRLTFAEQYAGGRMNGFVASLRRLGVDDPGAPMGFYDGRDIPFHWAVAHEYVLFDRFFASAAGGSVMNHMYWLTGTPGDERHLDTIPPGGFGALPTIFDRLQAHGISWKVYVEDYDPAITFRTAARHRRGSQATWMPLLSYARYVDDRRLMRHIVDLHQLFSDADRGRLPAVAFVVPAGSSEHPPGSVQAGGRLVRRIVNALTLSPQWNSSAFMWTYDNWGGWYDHVPPPRVDRFGYGFRVPALLVSPYARRGYVDHTTLDFTSALRFIERNWHLRPLAGRDAHAHSIAGAFDFTRGPRRPELLAVSAAPAQRPVTRVFIYGGYGATLAVALALLVMAVREESRLPRRRGHTARREGRS